MSDQRRLKYPQITLDFSHFPTTLLTNLTYSLPGCLPGGSVVENLPANAGDTGDIVSVPGLERSPGEGNGNQLQYSCLGSLVDRGAWWATICGVARVGQDFVTIQQQIPSCS